MLIFFLLLVSYDVVAVSRSRFSSFHSDMAVIFLLAAIPPSSHEAQAMAWMKTSALHTYAKGKEGRKINGLMLS